MFNFENLFDLDDEKKPIEPDRIFSSLVKSNEQKYEYLRDVQTEILNEWFPRRNEKDLIIKMNTGAGKTFVGLLILQSSLNEDKGPAVYVCPNEQLVDQVMEKSREYGIKCVKYEKGSQYFPLEFLNGEAILVTVFDKVFNGKSVFNKHDIEIGSIILDDAHSCTSKAREKFTIKIKRDVSNLYEKIHNLFEKSLCDQNLGSAESIYRADSNTIMQVPFWTWMDNIEEVVSLLSEASNNFELGKDKNEVNKSIYFNWPILRDNLESCYVFISGDTIEITPHCIPIKKFKYFNNCKRRIFMSATLLDDSSLIKDLNINESAITNPIFNKQYYNIGERMILMPSSIHQSLNSEKVSNICSKIEKNKIVLVPALYKKYIEKWEEAGAELLSSGNISYQIKKLAETKNNFFILANRYDGIDLHGDQCRLLIIDSLPLGATLYERFLKEARPSSEIITSLLCQKIEQGIGRSTRSSSDYSVVIFTGSDLETRMYINKNRKYLSSQTRKQIEIGTKFIKKLPSITEENAEEALVEIMDALFKRNPNWVKFHNAELQKAKEEEINKIPIEIAVLERKAYDLYNANRSSEASQVIESIINKLGNDLDDFDKGWYLQLAAFYKYKNDKKSSLLKQLKAHELNNNLSKTIEGITYRKLEKNNGLQENIIYSKIQSYSDINGILVYINSLLENIKFGIDSNIFEQSFMELGEFLGYEAQRPEKSFRNGLPDVLWNMTNNEFIIFEAKNEVYESRKYIYKEETEQITNGFNWFNTEYKGKKGYPVLIHPSDTKDSCAYPAKEVKVITNKELTKLKNNILQFVRFIVTNFNKPLTIEMIGEQLNLMKLKPNQFISNYTNTIKNR